MQSMWELLGKTEKTLGEAFPSLPSMQRAVKGSDPYTQYTKYLNSLSDIVREELDKRSERSEEAIRFFDRHNNPSKDPVTGTTNRPDFFAMKLRADEPAPSVFYWSALEATGELLSGNDKENPYTEAMAYTSYLLQSRPDMVTVQGIYVDPNGFRLVVSNACGAFHTERIEWELRSSHLLLCAWIWRLYEPVVDPSITANTERNKPTTFDIRLPRVTYLNCTIHSAGTAFGRRTIILTCPEPKVVIKEQYVETFLGFEEGPTLSKIHKKGVFPGVVRPGWYGLVESSKEKELVVKWGESERKKIRMVLLDKAPSIMDAKTPREALVAMYDLLEITRFLHKKRKILHRDISCNNVLLRDVVPPYTSFVDGDPLPAAVPAKQSITEELREMCFASYLLQTKCNSITSPGRLDTGVLLIDFDMSEDQEPGNQGGDNARTGTPIFMARAVVSGRQRKGYYMLEPMPQLGQGNETYKAAVPNRLEAFPPNKEELHRTPSDIPYKPFKHKLQYDAESVFWLLLWWAIRASPVESTSPDHKEIDRLAWLTLTSEQNEKWDSREYFIGRFPGGVIHPVYKPLETLLRSMAEQLCGDHEKGDDQSRKHDEYLHEAFQRLIFNFLFDHYDEGFMAAQKELKFRKPEGVSAIEESSSSHQINKTRTLAASSPHGIQSTSSRGIPSGFSLKRKRSDEDASSSNPNDEDYPNKLKHRK